MTRSAVPELTLLTWQGRWENQEYRSCSWHTSHIPPLGLGWDWDSDRSTLEKLRPFLISYHIRKSAVSADGPEVSKKVWATKMARRFYVHKGIDLGSGCTLASALSRSDLLIPCPLQNKQQQHTQKEDSNEVLSATLLILAASPECVCVPRWQMLASYSNSTLV